MAQAKVANVPVADFTADDAKLFTAEVDKRKKADQAKRDADALKALGRERVFVKWLSAWLKAVALGIDLDTFKGAQSDAFNDPILAQFGKRTAQQYRDASHAERVAARKAYDLANKDANAPTPPAIGRVYSAIAQVSSRRSEAVAIAGALSPKRIQQWIDSRDVEPTALHREAKNGSDGSASHCDAPETQAEKLATVPKDTDPATRIMVLRMALQKAIEANPEAAASVGCTVARTGRMVAAPVAPVAE